jgi:hypothetical protein
MSTRLRLGLRDAGRSPPVGIPATPWVRRARPDGVRPFVRHFPLLPLLRRSEADRADHRRDRARGAGFHADAFAGKGGELEIGRPIPHCRLCLSRGSEPPSWTETECSSPEKPSSRSRGPWMTAGRDHLGVKPCTPRQNAMEEPAMPIRPIHHGSDAEAKILRVHRRGDSRSTPSPQRKAAGGSPWMAAVRPSGAGSARRAGPIRRSSDR